MRVHLKTNGIGAAIEVKAKTDYYIHKKSFYLEYHWTLKIVHGRYCTMVQTNRLCLWLTVTNYSSNCTEIAMYTFIWSVKCPKLITCFYSRAGDYCAKENFETTDCYWLQLWLLEQPSEGGQCPYRQLCTFSRDLHARQSETKKLYSFNWTFVRWMMPDKGSKCYFSFGFINKSLDLKLENWTYCKWEGNRNKRLSFPFHWKWKRRLKSTREFSARRWTAACTEWEGGGTARDPVSWERGDAKIKQKSNTSGSGGK